MRNRLSFLICALSLTVLPSCAHRAAQVTIPPAAAWRDFVDLQPGWRRQVITPLLKSGGFTLPNLVPQVSGNTVTLSDGGELEGYETSFYAVAPHPKGGVRISFASAEVTRKGVSLPQPSPVLPLFQLPSQARYVRLVFLTRVSGVNHDMAVLATREAAELDRLSSELEVNPGVLGIAVRPQGPVTGPGGAGWGPVR